ncbi:glycosyltransferase family 4 protein [Oerskovia enterophila]|uniref:D-inositol 3-phosphate glycosyltransferase n=1 Tax=Oerskovia enterophila TaxID=43678 RepID=A0A163Q8Q6_9CELL|nr:glycosyltransferase family 1 protein [Oerskovia enterophila]KZM33902.1 D-inositol 3-phosphate glycosyltransferase [Oerskovia enterophila]OCI32564.1 D-inositol 3-phosphate glycosyltransferase [Oerskovia enterophila]
MPRSSTPRVALVVEQLWQPVPGGSGTYVRELANGLVRSGAARVRGIRAHGAAGELQGLDPRVPISMSRLPRRVLYESWRRLRTPRVPGGRDLDLVHATTWAIPPAPVPLVVTVHDLAFLREPEHFTKHGAAYFRDALAITREEAAVVIVPSEATARDCVSAGIERGRVRVVPHGVTSERISADDVADFRRRNGLERPYLLWVGTLEPRKNLPTLLRAYSELRSDGTHLDLVLVGPTGWGETADEVNRAVEVNGPDRVHRLGKLSQHDLQAAYAGARAFCFPSVWEGFGLPVLEAQAHGTPVVTSRGTSMEEICGPSALAVDPLDVPALAEALLLATGDRHDELSAAGRVNSSRFTWDAAVTATATVYQEVIS